MIKATELRIYNHVMCRGALSVVTKIDTLSIGYLKSSGKGEAQIPLRLVNGIPLTEEILLKFGFENGSMYEIGNDKKDEIFVSLKTGIAYISDSRDTNYSFLAKCQYVHQLQNLFFSLCGEELTCRL